MFLQIEPLKICIYKYICTCGVLNIYAAKCFFMPETDTNFQKQIESGEEDSYIYIYIHMCIREINGALSTDRAQCN